MVPTIAAWGGTVIKSKDQNATLKMCAIEFEQIHKSLWTDVTAVRKDEIVRTFARKHLSGWTRELMPSQEYGKGVFVYRKPNTSKVLWIEAFSFDAPSGTARIWTGWKYSSYRFLDRKNYSVDLCFIFSDSGMFTILPANLVSKWLRHDPDLNQEKWFIEIAPEEAGLSFRVTGARTIEKIVLTELFMNIELVGVDYPEGEPSREDLYRVLLRSCSEGIGNTPRTI